MVKRDSSEGAFILGTACGLFLTSMFLISSLLLGEDNTQYTSTEDIVFTNEVRVNPYEHDSNYTSIESTQTKQSRTPITASLAKDSEQIPYSSLHEYKEKGEEAAKEMANNVHILCWIATQPENHKTKAVHIKNTWGKRCNVLLFVSSKNDETLPAIAIDLKENRRYLFDKTKAAMKYIYRHYLNTVEWVLKTDDDTFVIVENLRHVLSKFNPSNSLYLGCRFKPFAKQGFMSGGAGYVLSRGALKRFVEEAILDKRKCLQTGIGNGEDVELGICLENVDVAAEDSRDDLGRGRFFPYQPEFHLFPDHSSKQYEWYWKYQYYPDPEGLNCCSDSAVSFHYISPAQLQVLNYLVYTLKPYGTSLYYYNATSLSVSV